MTETRKKLQNTLRRKFGYKTHANRGNGTRLIKEIEINGFDPATLYVIMDYVPRYNGEENTEIIVQTKKKVKSISIPREELILLGKIAEEIGKEDDDFKEYLKKINKAD